MELAPALARYAHALGRWQAAWSFASPALRRAVSLAQISAAWDVFRRDAGPGAVGREHAVPADAAGITAVDDPRRDGLLLWLADHGVPALTDAAGQLSRMVGASGRFDADKQVLLQVAGDALNSDCRSGPIAGLLPQNDSEADDALAPLGTIAAAVDRLRSDPAFLESTGAEVRHQLPRGALRYYITAEPAATWALNLALLTQRPSPQGTLAVPGLVSRLLFRPDAEPEELATTLVAGATAALMAAYVRIETLCAELDRGGAALIHMSRNARAGDAWMLIAALGAATRTQLGRGLDLSRAGADIQARVLATAGLVTLERGGWMRPAKRKKTTTQVAPLDHGPLQEATAALDESMAAIDRLLAKKSGAG